jgi:hypothetical protein
MIIEETIKGTYGEVSVSVQIHGAQTSDMVTPEGVADRVEMAIGRFDDQLQNGLYQVNTSMTTKTRYLEQNGFEYNDMVVKVECDATLRGATGLSRVRSYIRHLSEPLTRLLVEYFDGFEGSFEAALAALMPKVELV